jgi:hypothetical protein
MGFHVLFLLVLLISLPAVAEAQGATSPLRAIGLAVVGLAR